MASSRVICVQPVKRKIKAVVVQDGHRPANLSLLMDLQESRSSSTDLIEFESVLRKKSKFVAKRLDLAKEVQFERQNSDLEWEIIGDSSPLKHGDTVQVVIENSTVPVNVAIPSHTISPNVEPSVVNQHAEDHVRKLFQQDEHQDGLHVILF